jgi:uncharacterized membrane protein
MTITKQDMLELKSWLTTTFASIFSDLLFDIVLGLGTLAQTGSFTTAGAVAVATACIRTTAKYVLSLIMEKLKAIRK